MAANEAALSLSAHLTARRHRHVVLERGRIGESWRSRWDSLHLLTPNWLNRLDRGAAHGEPGGFLARDEFVEYLDRYALPVSKSALARGLAALGLSRKKSRSGPASRTART